MEITKIIEVKKETKEDSFIVLQCKDGCQYRFMPMNGPVAFIPRIEDYEEVYSARLYGVTSLEDIFYTFNHELPVGYSGHSLSVSDIVITIRQGKPAAYFVDSVGFKQLCNFLPKDIDPKTEDEDEIAFNIADRNFLCQISSEGSLDISVYDDNYKMIDGMVLDEPTYSLREYVPTWIYETMNEFTSDNYKKKILGRIDKNSVITEIDYDALFEKVEELEKFYSVG